MNSAGLRVQLRPQRGHENSKFKFENHHDHLGRVKLISVILMNRLRPSRKDYPLASQPELGCRRRCW